jgi:hypothetical protein
MEVGNHMKAYLQFHFLLQYISKVVVEWLTFLLRNLEVSG